MVTVLLSWFPGELLLFLPDPSNTTRFSFHSIGDHFSIQSNILIFCSEKRYQTRCMWQCNGKQTGRQYDQTWYENQPTETLNGKPKNLNSGSKMANLKTQMADQCTQKPNFRTYKWPTKGFRGQNWDPKWANSET